MTEPGKRKDQLFAVARELLEAEQERKRTEAVDEAQSAVRAQRRAWLVPVLGGLSLVMAALLVIRPEFLAGPKTPPTDAPAVRAANQRGVLAVVATQLRAYEARTGALPTRLEEAGIALPPDVQYRRVDASHFVLRSVTPPVITFTSEDDPSGFLTGELGKLRGRAR